MALKQLAKAAKKVSKAAETVQKKGSIATKTSTSETAIREAKTLKDISVARAKIKEMKDPELRKFFLAELKKKEDKIRNKQAKEADTVSRKQQQSASDRKKFKGFTPKSPFAKGGYAKKYNKGGYANCGASVPATQGRKK